MGHMTTLGPATRQAELISANYNASKYVEQDEVRVRRNVEPLTYGQDVDTCSCGYITYSFCKQCNSPACGNCLDTVAHADRFHAASA